MALWNGIVQGGVGDELQCNWLRRRLRSFDLQEQV